VDKFTIIKRPLVTEKVSKLQGTYNQYAFEVDKRANKIQIKKAIEERFGVKVLKVRTMNVKGKVKRLGRFQGKRPDWKKAIVTLREGDTIEIFQGS